MRAFLERIEKEWLDDFVYLSVQPLKDLGVEIIPFDGTNMNKFKQFEFEADDIVIGSVEATLIFFESQGKNLKYLGYPEELYKHLWRDIKTTSYFTADKMMPYPFFIKPAIDIKLFTGSLCENEKQLKLIQFLEQKVTNETLVYISEPIDFLSEYRCFVHKRQLVGIKHYTGDFFRFPDIGVINQMILEYKDCPISYTLDVGIYKNNIYTGPKAYSTALVEVNDFWAIGGYGLDGKTYVRMLIDRFQEIKNK